MQHARRALHFVQSQWENTAAAGIVAFAVYALATK